MTRWEYQTIKIKAKGLLGGKIDDVQVDTALNTAGRDGWELAGTESVTSSGITTCVLLIFKRPTH